MKAERLRDVFRSAFGSRATRRLTALAAITGVLLVTPLAGASGSTYLYGPSNSEGGAGGEPWLGGR
jgi:hypothetical protein